MEQIIELINKLKKSPLYAMSISSIELFHSNFWQWLMNFNKEYVKVFFKNENINLDEIKDIEREYKNTDISIKYQNVVYIIENKIKSLPTESQLESYENKFKNRELTFKKGVCVWIRDFKISSNNWNSLIYEDVLNEISNITKDLECKETDANQKIYFDIIKEYIDMTRTFIEVIERTLEKYKNIYIAQENKDMEELEKIRLADIVKKINGNELLNYLRSNLNNKFKDYYSHDGFNHKNATISIRRLVKFDDESKYLIIGPQLEGNNFRRMIHITNESFNINKKRDDIEKVYKAIKEKLFAKDHNSKNSFEYPKENAKKPYNEYKGICEDKGILSKQEYIAIYKYDKLKELEEFTFEKILERFQTELEFISRIDIDALLEDINNRNKKTIK